VTIKGTKNLIGSVYVVESQSLVSGITVPAPVGAGDTHSLHGEMGQQNCK